jgi:hypothetical protein
LIWLDAPLAYDPHKPLDNRFIRWSQVGVFDRIVSALAGAGNATEVIALSVTY